MEHSYHILFTIGLLIRVSWVGFSNGGDLLSIIEINTENTPLL